MDCTPKQENCYVSPVQEFEDNSNLGENQTTLKLQCIVVSINDDDGYGGLGSGNCKTTVSGRWDKKQASGVGVQDVTERWRWQRRWARASLPTFSPATATYLVQQPSGREMFGAISDLLVAQILGSIWWLAANHMRLLLSNCRIRCSSFLLHLPACHLLYQRK